jgi:hypothetical protein
MRRWPSRAARAAHAVQERQLRRKMKWRTRMLGAASVSTVAVLIGASAVRIWRLGSLPFTHGGESLDLAKVGPVRAAWRSVKIVREGYRVSSTRENVLVNMVASFVVTFGITRAITHTIRVRGGIGPIKNMKTAGGRHIHHFIPGAIMSLASGGVAIAFRPEGPDRYLAIPFGVGIALVLDEAALLLEFEDVYWSEEGALSVRLAFTVLGLLGAIAYAAQVRRAGRPGTEQDWRQAAQAWEDLQLLGR